LSQIRRCSTGSHNIFLAKHTRLVKKYLLREIHPSMYTYHDRPKWRFTRVKLRYIDHFKFSSFQSDQEMLCRISKYFCCKQFETCQKKYLLWEIQPPIYKCSNRLKWSIMSIIINIYMYLQSFLANFEFLIFLLHQELLCRISNIFVANNLRLVRKNICSEKSSHLYTNIQIVWNDHLCPLSLIYICIYSHFWQISSFWFFCYIRSCSAGSPNIFVANNLRLVRKNICSEKSRHLYTNVEKSSKLIISCPISCIYLCFCHRFGNFDFRVFRQIRRCSAGFPNKNFLASNLRLVRKISAQKNPAICIQISKSSEMIIPCPMSCNCRRIYHYIDHFQVFEFLVRSGHALQDLNVFSCKKSGTCQKIICW